MCFFTADGKIYQNRLLEGIKTQRDRRVIMKKADECPVIYLFVVVIVLYA